MRLFHDIILEKMKNITHSFSKNAQARRGMTLVELMIGVMIILVAVLALWRVYTAAVQLTILAREVSVVTDDVEGVMEKIKNLAFTDITTIFPDTQEIDPDLIGGYGLDDTGLAGRESIRVYYDDVDDDPLKIMVRAQWTSQDGHTYGGAPAAPEWDFYTLRSSGL